MENFVFRNPTKLIFGKGQIAAIESEIPMDAKVMVTYGGGSIKSNGVYDAVMAALKNHNVVEFAGIEPNPKYETLMKAVKYGKEQGVDYLLAVGGGSVIDGTKFIAVALNFDNDDEAWGLIVGKYQPDNYKATPLSSVLTLPATGSEMNKGAVISRLETDEKFAFYHKDNFPRFSVLDPETCYSLPKKQVANGLADTYCHVLEQYLTDTTNGMVNDRFAESLLLNVVELTPSLMEKHDDYDTMADFMLTATMGLNGFIAMGATSDWATHLIGHELTALTGLDHGVTLSIVGPALMDVMRSEKHGKLLQYAERVWGAEGSEDERIDYAINKTRELYEAMGIKTRLSDWGVDRGVIDTIVERFTTRKMNIGERGIVTPDKVRTILEKAY